MSNDWIPTASFIEYFVLEHALDKNVSIEKASVVVVPRFGLVPTGPYLHIQTRLLGMLYTLLVFPRETWKRQELLEVVIERAKADKDLIVANRDLISAGFIRSVRNAVAHGRVRFSNESVTFQDGKEEGRPSFDVTMKVSDVVNFLLVMGRAFHESAQVKQSTLHAGRISE